MTTHALTVLLFTVYVALNVVVLFQHPYAQRQRPHYDWLKPGPYFCVVWEFLFFWLLLRLLGWT